MKATVARLEAALSFAQALPGHLPDPELTAEEDGDICFEWYAAKSCLVSVSVGPHGINWAGTYGGASFHDGGKELTPPALLHWIRIIAREMPTPTVHASHD